MTSQSYNKPLSIYIVFNPPLRSYKMKEREINEFPGSSFSSLCMYKCIYINFLFPEYARKALDMDCNIPYIKRLWNDCLNNIKLILVVMELNNLPLPLKMSMDFIEDGNMIQLKFNILGYLKKEAWLCEGSDAKHSATIQLLVSSYFQYLLFVRWDDSK